MAYLVTADAYLDIDGVPLDTPAWTTTNLDDLRASPTLRGTDVLIPGASGYRAMPRRRAITQADIELAVVGDLDWEGTAYPVARIGLFANEQHLLDHVAALPTTTDSTRVATLHLPAELATDTLSATVHVERLRFVRKGPILSIGQLTLTILDGALLPATEAPSS